MSCSGTASERVGRVEGARAASRRRPRRHLRDLFADDPDRGERLVAKRGDLYLDYSKNRLTDETLRAAASRSPSARAARRASTRCSAARRSTSPRTAPCCTSRCARRAARSIEVDGENVVPAGARRARQDGATSPNRVRSGAWTGHTGKRIRNVVNIGIGGSDLGPAHGVRRAPRTSATASMTFRFVSNVDGTDFFEATQRPRSRRDAVHRLRRRRSPRSRR